MKVRAGIQAKLFLLISALAVAMALAFTVAGFRWYARAATHALEQKALTYGQLASRSVESAIAFDDHETAREAFSAVTIDADVITVALYREDGSVLEGRGEYLSIRPRALSTAASLERSAAAVTCHALVASKEGPRGTIVVVLSKASLARQIETVKLASILLAAAVMSVGFLIAWWLSRQVAQRIRRIAAAATSVASGVLTSPPVEDRSSDEIGELAAGFNTMVGELRRLVQQLETRAAREQERLEMVVAARTTELAARNGAMRLLLDSVAEGFLMLDSRGGVAFERSAAVDEWFGAPEPEVTFWDYMAAFDPLYAAWFEMSWDALSEGLLPAEVAIAQFPKRLSAGNRQFEVTLTPLFDDGALARTLVDIREITDQLERERVESAQREVLALLERALEDRSSYLEFMAEAGSLVHAVAHDKRAISIDVTRAVHTLKGNCALFGLTSLATFCHDVETRMTSRNGGVSEADRAELVKRWESATGRLAGIFSKTTGTLTVDREELDALVDALASGEPRRELLQRARLLRLESIEVRMNRFVDQARVLATRLGKEVEVSVDGAGLRFDPVAWGPYWASFAHVVRNALDHGVEAPERRISTGKSSVGTLAIRAHLQDGEAVLEIADDGCGIDWSTLAERARSAGLSTATRADLEAALFVDGFSTKGEISETSGRGAGLGAVRASCEALGGAMTIQSELGHGTTVRFRFPRAALGDAYAESDPPRALSRVG